MSDLQNQISTRVNAFVEEINKLARAAAIDLLSSALGAPAKPAAPVVVKAVKAVKVVKAVKAVKAVKVAKAPAAAPVAAAPAAVVAAPAAAPKAPRAKGRGKGAKRSAAEIAKTTTALAAFIISNPGLRIEQIGKALGEQTKDLALPIQKLMADGAIMSEGQRRATKYSPKSAAAPVVAAPAKAKAKKK